jgi:hypothetical protein
MGQEMSLMLPHSGNHFKFDSFFNLMNEKIDFKGIKNVIRNKWFNEFETTGWDTVINNLKHGNVIFSISNYTLIVDVSYFLNLEIYNFPEKVKNSISNNYITSNLNLLPKYILYRELTELEKIDILINFFNHKINKHERSSKQ